MDVCIFTYNFFQNFGKITLNKQMSSCLSLDPVTYQTKFSFSSAVLIINPLYFSSGKSYAIISAGASYSVK